MKQTAVEQLQEYLTISLGPDRMRMLANEFEKAKAMEKEQIMEAYEAAEKDCGRDFLHGDLYYHEIFESE